MYWSLSKNNFATRVRGNNMSLYYHRRDIVIIDGYNVDIKVLNGKESIYRYRRRKIFNANNI